MNLGEKIYKLQNKTKVQLKLNLMPCLYLSKAVSELRREKKNN